MDIFLTVIYYTRGVCDRDMGVVSRDFAEVGWRRGLGARFPRSAVRNQRNEAGCRHMREPVIDENILLKLELSKIIQTSTRHAERTRARKNFLDRQSAALVVPYRE